jgi:hypothetical protein
MIQAILNFYGLMAIAAAIVIGSFDNPNRQGAAQNAIIASLVWPQTLAAAMVADPAASIEER